MKSKTWIINLNFHHLWSRRKIELIKDRLLERASCWIANAKVHSENNSHILWLYFGTKRSGFKSNQRQPFLHFDKLIPCRGSTQSMKIIKKSLITFTTVGVFSQKSKLEVQGSNPIVYHFSYCAVVNDETFWKIFKHFIWHLSAFLS